METEASGSATAPLAENSLLAIGNRKYLRETKVEPKVTSSRGSFLDSIKNKASNLFDQEVDVDKIETARVARVEHFKNLPNVTPTAQLAESLSKSHM